MHLNIVFLRPQNWSRLSVFETVLYETVFSPFPKVATLPASYGSLAGRPGPKCPGSVATASANYRIEKP